MRLWSCGGDFAEILVSSWSAENGGNEAGGSAISGLKNGGGVEVVAGEGFQFSHKAQAQT